MLIHNYYQRRKINRPPNVTGIAAFNTDNEIKVQILSE
jgi:hypothetical protein